MTHKQIFSLSLIIIALSVSYYFVVFLPKHQKELILLEKQKADFSEQNNPIKLLEACIDKETTSFANTTFEICKMYPDCWNNGQGMQISYLPEDVKDGFFGSFDKAKDECYRKYK